MEDSNAKVFGSDRRREDLASSFRMKYEGKIRSPCGGCFEPVQGPKSQIVFGAKEPW